MKLFKRNNRENACCCAGQCTEENMQKAESQKERDRNQDSRIRVYEMYPIRKSSKTGSTRIKS